MSEQEQAPPQIPTVTDDSIKKPSFRWVDISDLKPYPNNARRHTENDVRVIMHSLAYYGWTNPVQVQRGTNFVIGGHGRLEAAKQLGLKKVPVVDLDHNDNDSKGYRIMDNRSAELSYWDMLTLKDELTTLDSENFNLGLTGYNELELKSMIDWEGKQFGAATDAEQGSLDKKKQVTCPECGHAFEA